MTYQPRSGDILSLSNEKAGALTMSVPLLNYPGPLETDPVTMWNTQSAIRIVTNYIARKVAAVPFHLYHRVSDTDRERITEGDVARMLARPTPGRGWSRFAEQLILDMAVLDRWACLIVQDPTGLSLEHLPANQVAVVTVRGVPQAVRVYRSETMSAEPEGYIDLPLDRVLFDVAPQVIPDTLDRGNPRLRTLSGVMAELEETGRWRRAVAVNGPQVPAVIERPVEAPQWSDEAYARFRGSWDEFKRGGGREGGTPILEDGMTLHETRVYTPDDGATASQALRKLSIEEAAMLYGIPPELVGVRPGNYSNVQAFREVEYVDVLGSWVTNLESAVNLGLIAAGLLTEDQYVEANVAARLKGAFEEQAVVLSSSVGAPWMTRNEARARMNLPAVEGGDELVTPLNVLVGGQPNPRTPIEDQGPAVLPDEGDDVDEDRDEERGTKALPYPWEPGWAEVELERAALSRDLNRFWKGQHARIVQTADAIERAGGLVAPPTDRKAESVTDYVLAQDELDRLMRARANTLTTAGANQVLVSFNPLSEGFTVGQMEAWAATAALNDSALWSHAITQRIAELLAADDPALWQAFLDDPAGGRAMIQRYARTWGTEFVEFGRHDAARSTGLRVKVWRTASARPRSTHQALSGTKVLIDEAFGNGAEYPGDWRAGADEVANCRCRLDYGSE
jgi:HK97 family phage portal protein